MLLLVFSAQTVRLLLVLLLLLLLLLSAFIKRTFADATNALKTAVTR